MFYYQPRFDRKLAVSCMERQRKGRAQFHLARGRAKDLLGGSEVEEIVAASGGCAEGSGLGFTAVEMTRNSGGLRGEMWW